MNTSECIEALEILLKCMDDKLQGERDKMTKLIDLKPSSFEYVLKETINLLTVEAEPVLRGRWIYDDDSGIDYCSECGTVSSPTNFCPCCGAKMEGAGNHAAD